MELLWQGLTEAIQLLIQRDPLVVSAAWRSLWISFVAVSFSGAVGITVGTLLARGIEALEEAKRYGHNRTFLYQGKYPAPIAPPELDIVAGEVQVG